MKTAIALILPAIAGLCLAGAVACGQSYEPDQQGNQPGQQGADKGQKPEQRAASAAGVELVVNGLNQTNSPRVESAIEGLVDKSKDGKDEAKLVESAAVDPAKGIVKVVVADEQQLRLSQVEKVLKSNQVELARDKLRIPVGSDLVVAGKQASDIVKALDEAKIGEVSVKPAETPGEFHIALTQAKEPPTFGAIAAALAKAGDGYKLNDVIWQGRTGRSKG